MKRYFPILLSKAGELSAMKHLTQTVKSEISPVIQLLPNCYDTVEAFASNEWSFDGNELFLDFSLIKPFDRAKARRLINSLVEAEVNVVPVMQNDSDPRYLTVLSGLLENGTVSNICIRFSNGSGGFLNIDSQVATLLGSMSATRKQASILLDFGYVHKDNFNLIAITTGMLVKAISHKNDFNNLIIASGSFPENLSILTPPGKVFRLQRYEWNIWHSLIAQPEIVGRIKYGDYGTKYPFYSESNYRGSCSIKYTGPTEYVIYRGELSNKNPLGNGQYLVFSDRLMKSNDYAGAGFSWGDSRIGLIGSQSLTDPNYKPGNATSWVEVSQNHHITLMHSLL